MNTWPNPVSGLGQKGYFKRDYSGKSLVGRFHGCWSHLCLSLFIPRGKRWKGGILSVWILHPP